LTEKAPKPPDGTISNRETIEAMEAARVGDLVKVGHPNRLIESLNTAQRPDVKADDT
jgi:hypothetical protein